MQSYAHGGDGPPLLGLTVSGVLDEAAARWPDKDALIVVDQQIRWTWNELRDRARALAAGLLSTGLHPGDRIGMLAPNRAEWLLAQFGSAYAGLILVNVNPAYRAPELEYALNKVGCRALITETQFKSSDYIAMMQTLAPELAASTSGDLYAHGLPELRVVIQLGKKAVPGMFSLDDVMRQADVESLQRLDEIAAQSDFDAPINIQFTSGTTGAPKAATLTHHNMINNALMSAAILDFSCKDRLCIPVPMYHCFGMVLGTLLCATTGAAIVFPGAAFEAEATLQAIEAESCTALHGVPTMFIAVLDEPEFEKYDLSSLRTGIMAGAPCPTELMQRVIEDMHMSEITIGYGMTETGPLSTQTSPRDSVERRVGTVGRALPHTEIKIVDEEGHIVAPDVAGELCVRGYNVMLGYWGDPERTAEDIDTSRWIRTGDVATMDENGYLRIVGRSKDMLIRGGENVYPREIENFLYTNPKINQVEVIGVPDPRFGEEIAACIQLQEGEQATEEEIRNYCRGKLAHFKIPRYVRFVDEFPMTVTGKVQKFILRERLTKELEQAFRTSQLKRAAT
ncbi:MAG: AMP-binding protein [Gammaproteobacteria bacterium]|nr:AMP-binding protein [Gammaproteobacteria bacterium]